MRRLSAPLAILCALVVSGCMQTTTANLTTPPAAGDPLVLNTAPAPLDAAGASAPDATPATTAAAPTAAPAPAPQPVATAAPLNASPTAVVSEPLPGAQPTSLVAPATSEAPRTVRGYPNINAPPIEPGGVLLPEADRARIIGELEALRAGQGNSPGGDGNASALAEEAETHGARALQQIEKCSEEGAADKYPECAPTN